MQCGVRLLQGLKDQKDLRDLKVIPVLPVPKGCREFKDQQEIRGTRVILGHKGQRGQQAYLQVFAFLEKRPLRQKGIPTPGVQ
jgi:hypothetical protein